MGVMDRQQEFVLRTIEERDIRFVRLWFTDVLGILKSVAIAPAELEGAFAEGIGFDGSAIEGFARVYEADMLAKPDPSPSRCCRGAARAPGTGRMFCDILMPDGSPSYADPRHVLKRALAKAADLGLHLLHPPRDRVLPAQAGPETRRGARCRSTTAATSTTARTAAATTSAARPSRMLEAMGISVEFSHHEGAPGQQEIDLRYADALTTADNIMTFRLVVKEVALEQGVYATFMPKPFAEHPGSGMHTHLSLFEGDRNAFHEPGARVPAVQGRPQLHRRPAARTRRDHRGHQPVGQLLQAARRRRRGAGVRLLGPQQPLGAGPGADVQAGQGQRRPASRSARIDSACNPYLAFAVHAGRRAQGHRGGLRAARRAPRTTSGR